MFERIAAKPRRVKAWYTILHMKHFPFKILIICILLPPVLYILSMQTLEGHLQTRYAKEMEDIYIGDTAELFQGSVAIRDAISRNIDQYLQSKALLSMGVKVKVTVITKENTILYPAVYEDSPTAVTERHPAIQLPRKTFAC